jgi:hypothetical protein
VRIRKKNCSIKVENPFNNKIYLPIYFCDENTEDFSEKIATSKPIKITMKGNWTASNKQKTESLALPGGFLLNTFDRFAYSN